MLAAAAAALALAAAGLALSGAPGLPLAYAQQPAAATWQSVANVTSDSGAYGEGRTISVTVAFDAPVGYSVVAPVLQLNVSGSARAAAYASGNDSSRLVFSYAVGPGDYAGDLGYRGTDSLTGDIRYRNDTAANLALPAPGTAGSLSETSDVVADHAAPLLVAAGWVDKNDAGFGALDGAKDVAAVAVGNRTYVLASATGGGGSVHLIRVHDNGSLAATADVALDSEPGYSLNAAYGIDAVNVDGVAYAFATPFYGHGVQMIRVHADGTMEPAGFVADDVGLSLKNPIWPAAFEMNGTAHVLVGSFDLSSPVTEGGVQLLRVGEGGLETAGTLDRTDNGMINEVFGLDVFDIGDEKHALVSAHHQRAVHLIKIHENGSLSPVDSLSDTESVLALSRPSGSAVFSLGGSLHALVTAFADADGDIQLIRIGEGGMLEAAGLADNGAGGFTRLHSAEDASFVGTDAAGAGAYVLVGSNIGVQLVYVRGDDGALLPAGSAWRGDSAGFELDNGYATVVFDLGGRPYAAVAADHNPQGVQLIRMSPAAPVRAASPAPDGAYGEGSEIDIAVEFDGNVRVEGPLGLLLNTGRTAALVGGNETSTLVFRYEVQEGDSAAGLEYAEVGALSGAGSITDMAAGVAAGRALPPPGSGRSLGDTADIAVDGRVPPIVSVASTTANGTYGPGDAIVFSVVFGAPVQAAGQLAIRLNSGGSASYVSSSGPETLVFRYVVQEGEQVADLDYLAGADALAGTGTITGAATGQPAGRALPPPGSGMSLGDLKDIAVDARAPSVESVSASVGDGVYGAGMQINVTVAFDEPVRYSGEPPALRLDVGGEGRQAAYASGNGTSALEFSYAVRAGDYEEGDLDYLGTGALSGTIADMVGSPANLALPQPGSPGSLAGSSGILVDHGAPRLIGNGSVADGAAGFAPLAYSLDVDAVAVGDSTYAAVVTLGNNIQTIRVHGNGTLEAAGRLAESSNPNTLELSGAYGVDAFYMGGSAYAIVASQADNGVQLARILGNGTLVGVDSLDDNAALSLGGAVRVAAFEMDGAMHAIVAAGGDASSGGVQLVRISEDGLEARGSLADNAALSLGGAYGVDVFDLGGRPHALVSGETDDGVQLIRVNANGSLSPVSSLGDDARRSLDRPRDVAAFDLGGRPHALVASEADDGVQLLRIGGDGAIEAVAGPAVDGARGFDEMNGAYGVDEFVLGGNTHALVAARTGDGLQMIRIRAGDGAMFAAGSAAHGSPGFPRLNGAFAVDAFTLDGRPYAMIVSAEGGSVQLARLSPVAVANVTSPAATGTYEVGDTVNISVAFDGSVAVAEPLELRLNTGGYAGYVSGSGTGTLVFRYTVADGDRDAASLDYAGIHALRAGPGGSITESGTGLHARAVLPPPGSAGSLGGGSSIAIDTAPRIASVTSPDEDGTYGTGAVINITVRFTEPVAFDPPNTRPELELETGNENDEHRHAVCAPAESASDELACTYTVRRGDATADLGYEAGSSLIVAGATAADADGKRLNPLLPASPADSLSGSKDIALDTAVPEVLRVTSPDADGTYGRGSVVRIDVVFNGTVDIDPKPSAGSATAPVLHLETGENDRAAPYAGGSGTDTLRFAYTVIAGDFAADLDYAARDGGALTLGHGAALVDEYGNRDRIPPALPEPGSPASLRGQKDIEIRTVPTVEGVEANYSGTFLKVGAAVGIRVQFSEKVDVAPAPDGSLPYIELDTGRDAAGRASYSSGAGSHGLVFAYPVHPDDSTPALDYAGTGALALNGARIHGPGADARLALPAPGSAGSLAAAGIELRSNEAPSINPPGNRTHGSGVELREGITAFDPEREPVAFSLVEPVPEGASIDAATGLLTWTPTEAQRGADNTTHVITVRASDPHAAGDTARLAVTVIVAPPEGHAGPVVADIPDAEGSEGEEIRLDIRVAGDGGPHGPYTYSLAVDAEPPPPRGTLVHYNGTFSWTPWYDQNGTHQITARAVDRYGVGGTGSFAVAVLDAEPPWNRPPAIEPLDPRSADEGERLVVRVSASDPDAPIAYSLAGDPPARSSIDAATGVFVWDIRYDQAGAHNITVSAADRYGRASNATLAVSVADVDPPDLPPSIDPIPDQRVTAGTAMSLQVAAYDPNEGDAVTFDLAGPPPGAVITTGGLFTWTPGVEHVGLNTLNVTATDDRGLSSWAPLAITVVDLRNDSAMAEAVFAGPRTVRIDYTAPLGPPAGHAGAVYGAVSIAGGGAAAPASVSGLGTSTHIVRLDGDAAGRGQNGTIALLAGLEMAAASGGVRHTFADDSIPIGAGEDARTLAPPAGTTAPVAAIERDGFVRAVDATAAGDGARPAINVTGLAAAGGGAQGTVMMPGDNVTIIASFAEVTFPPNVVASSVPADGLLELYVSPRPPAAEDVARAFGAADDAAAAARVLLVVEAGDSAARIEFDMPVRILLRGQANGSAFYVDGAAGEVVPITNQCYADDAAAVHARLGGSGECWMNSGGDKVVYTYHLTRFGAASVPATMCGATLERQNVDFAGVGKGRESDPVPQGIWRAYDSLPLAEVAIEAGNWTRTGGSDGGFAMPGNATQVREGGADGPWTPLEGVFSTVPRDGGWSAPVEFRLVVPADAIGGGDSDVAVSQTVTYTVECEAPPER